jgi:hypothetical protein
MWTQPLQLMDYQKKAQSARDVRARILEFRAQRPYGVSEDKQVFLQFYKDLCISNFNDDT